VSVPLDVKELVPLDEPEWLPDRLSDPVLEGVRLHVTVKDFVPEEDAESEVDMVRLRELLAVNVWLSDRVAVTLHELDPVPVQVMETVRLLVALLDRDGLAERLPVKLPEALLLWLAELVAVGENEADLLWVLLELRENEGLCVPLEVRLLVQEKLAELVHVEEDDREVVSEEVSEKLLVCVGELVRLTLRLLDLVAVGLKLAEKLTVVDSLGDSEPEGVGLALNVTDLLEVRDTEEDTDMLPERVPDELQVRVSDVEPDELALQDREPVLENDALADFVKLRLSDIV